MNDKLLPWQCPDVSPKYSRKRLRIMTISFTHDSFKLEGRRWFIWRELRRASTLDEARHWRELYTEDPPAKREKWTFVE